jgi:hypothetical protein
MPDMTAAATTEENYWDRQYPDLKPEDLHLLAVIDCAPQAGMWTPWTGAVCYGEKP